MIAPALVTTPPRLSVSSAPTRITPAFAPAPVPARASKVPPVIDKVAFAASWILFTVSLLAEVTVNDDPTASRIASSDAPGTFPPLQSAALVKLPLSGLSQCIADM